MREQPAGTTPPNAKLYSINATLSNLMRFPTERVMCLVMSLVGEVCPWLFPWVDHTWPLDNTHVKGYVLNNYAYIHTNILWTLL